MITYNFDKDFAPAITFPEDAEVVGLQGPDGTVLWRFVSELRSDDSLHVLDVPAGTFAVPGRLLALWQPAPAGGGGAWDCRNRWLGWTPTTAVLSRGHELQVRLDRQSNGRYRADMQYATRDNGRTMTLSPDCAVVAMRCRLPKDAVVTWDVVTADGTTANTKDTASQISMADGTTLLLCHLADAAAAGAMPVFQIKIADIPAALVSSMATPSYDVWWIRAFASEADARAFMNAESAQSAERAQHSRVYIGRGHRRRGADAADRINELKDARNAALQERDAALQQAEDTASELEAVRAELAAVDPAGIIDGAVECGRVAVEFAMSKFYYDHDDPYWGYGYDRWTEKSIEQNLGYTEPWIAPAFALPPPDEAGHLPSFATFFGGCTNLLYCGPIDLGECTRLDQSFQQCTALREAPVMDTSKVTNFAAAVMYCHLEDYPEWDYSSATAINGFMQNNPVVRQTSAIHLPNVTNMYQMLWSCPNLQRIGPIYAPKATDIAITSSLANLERVDEIDYACGLTNSLVGYQYNAVKLRYARFINVGKSALTAYEFGFPNWGDGSEENRRSLIDSLITCSYDRAAAGMPVATIALHTNTIGRLTEEEIAEITAKGFSIITKADSYTTHQ